MFSESSVQMLAESTVILGAGDAIRPHWMDDENSEQDIDITGDKERKKFRTIWISDVHLGTRGCQADLLADFLKHNDCDRLYLVGDIIDGWQMKKKAWFPQAHINVIRRILTRSKRGTDVVYVTGNHDEFLRRYSGMSFGNIHLVDEAIHEAPDGRKYWVIHGDAFDNIVCNQRWLAIIGDFAYESLLRVNNILNRIRHAFGMEYWSLSAYLKYKVKQAVKLYLRL